MNERHPILGEELRHFAEIGVEIADADMFQHADRDDAVEMLADFTIILQAEIDMLGELPFGEAALGGRELFLRQGDAGHLGAAEIGEIERKAAPAAADVEHLVARLDEKLGGDMPLLGELRVVEALALVFEIGAGILPVRIEKQRVEPAVEIVMVGDVAACPAGFVALLPAADRHAAPGTKASSSRRFRRGRDCAERVRGDHRDGRA